MKISKRGKRAIQVAKDVIKQLNAMTYKVTEGSYCTFTATDRRKLLALGDNDQLQKTFKEVTNCRVCALGSIFVSGVRLHNNLKLSALKDSSDKTVSEYVGAYKIPKRYFSAKQLALIESAFERETMSGFGMYEGYISTEEFMRAIEFGERYKRPARRLRAIMENVIKNKGKFVV